jgi:formylglycine-generating enzyme
MNRGKEVSAMLTLTTLLALSLALPAHAAGGGEGAGGGDPTTVRIPAGSHLPLYANAGARIPVASFEIDRFPVTRADYLAFVTANPAWRRSRVNRAFASPQYLAGWRGDLAAGGAGDARRPVTHVSWFAARAYCAVQGKRLPTTVEWEHVAAASGAARDASRDPAFIAGVLRTYTTRRFPAAPVGGSAPNRYGVHHLHDRTWEWVEDFNSVLVSHDSRGTAGSDRKMFCAAGAIGATDPGNYPAFLRYGFRAGLEGRAATPTLGFRCARSIR